MNRTSTAFAMAALVLASTAQADTRMGFSTGDGGVSHFAIKGDRIRMEKSDGGTVTLFDAGARELIVLEPAKRGYYRMDAERMQQQGRQVSEQMRQMREEMERQLENLPEEQRAMMREQMEQMMGSQMPQDQGQPADVRTERGGSARVGGIPCERVTVYKDGAVTQRLCVAAANGLGIPASDLETLRAMFSTLAEMAASFGAAADMGAPARVLDEFGGIPIEGKDAQGNLEWALQSVSDADLDPADFRVPAGYREIDPSAMGMGQ